MLFLDGCINLLKLITRRNFAIVICCFCGWVISAANILAQDDSVPSVDTFNSNNVSAPAYGSIPNGNLIQPGLVNIPVLTLGLTSDEKWTTVMEDIDRFRKSLPNNSSVLRNKLKGLIQECVNEWDTEWDAWKKGRWEGYCDAILRKLPNDKCEYA